MKRILIVSFIALMSVVLVSGVANAKIASTICVDCHTMHNSQNGAMVAQVWTTGGGMTTASGPYGALLNKDCISCHYYDGATTVVDNIPKVFNSNDPTTNALAAGNFYYVASLYGNDNAKGHNVAGIADAETGLMASPPGFMPSITLPAGDGSGPGSWDEQLRCAGTYGCHGHRNTTDQFGAIRGGHHGEDSSIDGSTIPKSYRFLSGILGEELNSPVADRWEYPPAPTSSLHNAYKGATDITTSESDKNSISYLCAECHWYFHTTGTSGVGTASPWLRHPTDIAFSTATGASVSEYLSYTTYNPVVPVGWDTPAGKSTVSTVTSANIVICLSCHRAHASPNNDLLRWNYEGVSMVGSAGNGDCKTCHTTK
jgi:cytochrome c553